MVSLGDQISRDVGLPDQFSTNFRGWETYGCSWMIGLSFSAMVTNSEAKSAGIGLPHLHLSHWHFRTIWKIPTPMREDYMQWFDIVTAPSLYSFKVRLKSVDFSKFLCVLWCSGMVYVVSFIWPSIYSFLFYLLLLINTYIHTSLASVKSVFLVSAYLGCPGKEVVKWV